MFDAEPQNSSITLQKGRGRLVVAAFSSLTRILLNKEYSFHKWIYACLESLSVIHDTGRCAVVAMKFVVSAIRRLHARHLVGINGAVTILRSCGMHHMMTLTSHPNANGAMFIPCQRLSSVGSATVRS